MKIQFAVKTLESSSTYKTTVYYLFPVMHINAIKKAVFFCNQE